MSNLKARPFLSYAELQQLEDLEEERQKEALRKFLKREREPVEVTGKAILWFFIKVTFWAAILGLVVVGSMAL